MRQHVVGKCLRQVGKMIPRMMVEQLGVGFVGWRVRSRAGRLAGVQNEVRKQNLALRRERDFFQILLVRVAVGVEKQLFHVIRQRLIWQSLQGTDVGHEIAGKSHEPRKVAGFEKCLAEFLHEVGPRHLVNEIPALYSRLERVYILPVKFPRDTGSLIDEGAESPSVGVERNVVVYEQVFELETIV